MVYSTNEPLPPRRQPRKVGTAKLVVSICGGLVALFGLTIIGLLAYFSTQPEGGVHLNNQLTAREQSHLSELDIPLESVLAYFDRSVSLDKSDVVVVTRAGVLHTLDGRRSEIEWSDVTAVETRDEGMTGEVVELETGDGQIFRIVIPPLNGGAALQKQVRLAWGNSTTR